MYLCPNRVRQPLILWFLVSFKNKVIFYKTSRQEENMIVSHINTFATCFNFCSLGKCLKTIFIFAKNCLLFARSILLLYNFIAVLCP